MGRWVVGSLGRDFATDADRLHYTCSHGGAHETADPGKFPDEAKKALGIVPEIPQKMQEQAGLEERIYRIESEPKETKQGLKLSDAQIKEAKDKIRELFS